MLNWSSYTSNIHLRIMSAALEADADYEATLFGALHRQFTTPKPLPAGIKLNGQTAIVTGSNGGLGLEACRQLLSLHLSHLILGVRSQTRGEAAAKQLRERFSDPDITISVWIVDMESYDSIQQFAARCATLPRIDIVVLNAAAVSTVFKPNATTGHESTMQVNYLSTFLLGILLLPVLRASGQKNKSTRPPVLSFVGSDLAYGPQYVPKIKDPVLPQYDNKDIFDFFSSYATSKLFLLLSVSRLSELIDPAEVLLNLSNPGFTRHSDLDRNATGIVRLGMRISRFILGRSLEAGASVYLDATLARGPESHGSFISDWAVKP